MYDWPEVRWATDTLWSAIAERLRAAGVAAPDRLEREKPFDETWLDPALVLSQTCGWPYATRLRGSVRLVATPVYAVDGCAGPNYSSAIVVRGDEASAGLVEFRGRRFAFNSDNSLSGFVALNRAIAEAGLSPADAKWVETGSHRASVRAVAEGSADLASIDSVAWALAQRYEADPAGCLRVLVWTPLRPGLPWITSCAHNADKIAAIRAALDGALADPALSEARALLFLARAADVPEAAYETLPRAA
jgi:ABC-type phosphate/phosphonate transport system substrate-binding protein